MYLHVMSKRDISALQAGVTKDDVLKGAVILGGIALGLLALKLLLEGNKK